MTYRPEIDGLRAIAVLSVLFYHARLPPFFGGFIGVDVFFVISGFLITSLLKKEIAEGTFSLPNFYERRVRRIFPALYVTLALTLAVGTVLLSSAELRMLHEAVIWLVVFCSNVYFMNNVGYFDGASEENPVLQTWSLAIEEQFYLIYPLILVELVRRKPAWVKPVLVAIAVASFSYGVVTVAWDARPAFFSALGRAWELLLGAWVALASLPTGMSSRSREIASWTGLFLVGASVLLLSADAPFPGALALPACAGCALVIWSNGPTRTMVGGLLASRPFVFVGLISYSLYLLHWPLLVFVQRALRAELTISISAATLAVAFVLAVLSWRFIETPIRKGLRHLPSRHVLSIALAIVATTGSASFILSGWYAGQLTVVELETATERAQAKAEPCLLPVTSKFSDWPRQACSTPGPGGAIVFWGDSFAAHYFEPFRSASAKVDYFAQSSCPPIVGLDIPNRPNCKPFNDEVLSDVKRLKPAVVILSADWMVYEKKKVLHEAFSDKFELIERLIDVLRENGIDVLVVGASPIFPIPVPQIASSESEAGENASAKASYSRRFDHFFRALQRAGKIEYFSPYEVLCDGASYCRYKEDGRLIFWDEGHFTHFGATLIVNALRQKSTLLRNLSLPDSVNGPN